MLDLQLSLVFSNFLLQALQLLQLLLSGHYFLLASFDFGLGILGLLKKIAAAISRAFAVGLGKKIVAIVSAGAELMTD